MEISQDLYSIIYLISALINLLVLIMFFVLVGNVRAIKKTLVQKRVDPGIYLEEYFKWRRAGYREKAAKALHGYFWEKTRVHQMGLNTTDNFAGRYESVVKECTPYFEAIDEPIPKHEL